MPRRKRNNNRNKSSEGDELEAKWQRRDNGGSAGGQSLSQSVSDLIKDVRHTLYSDGEENNANTSLISHKELDVSVNSVFDNANVANADNTKMADSGSQISKGESDNSCSLKDVMTLLTAINSKINIMDSRLEKLEHLESKVDKLDTEIKSQINKLWNHVNDTTKRLDERVRKVEESAESNSFVTGEIAEKVTLLEKECKRARDDMSYIQSQSMRNNLVFSNIPEEKDETSEMSERILRNFMNEKLQMAKDLVDEIKFERVHRMGQRRQNGKGRSIVAKFSFFKDREDVRRQSSKLKNSDYFINEQFPKDVADRRKKLYPRLMAERKAGHKAWLSYDALYVDGRRVDGGSD